MKHEEYLINLLLYNPYYINTLQIKPNYLLNKDNQIILDAIIKAYNKYNSLNIPNIIEFVDKENKNRIINTITEIITSVLYTKSTNMNDYLLVQEQIINSYKIKILINYTDKLKGNEISLNEYNEMISKINNKKIIKETNLLTKEEITNNIKLSDKQIKLNNFPKLSNTLRLVENDLMVIGAFSGTGKTSFLLNLMEDLSDRYQCIYFNVEMSKTSIYRRIIGISGDIPINDIDNPKGGQQEVIDIAVNEIARRKIIMEHQVNTVKDIKAVVARVKDKDKHTIVFVDHIGLIKAETKIKSIYENSTEVPKMLRDLCLNYNCTVIATSQFNKASRGEKEVHNGMLKDSGEVENSARKVILLTYVDGQDKSQMVTEMNLDITKNDTGIQGTIIVEYDKPKQIFKEKICG